MSAAEQIQAEQELPESIRQPRHVSRMQEHKRIRSPNVALNSGSAPQGES